VQGTLARHASIGALGDRVPAEQDADREDQVIVDTDHDLAEGLVVDATARRAVTDGGVSLDEAEVSTVARARGL
jgi:hypothetical protein